MPPPADRDVDPDPKTASDSTEDASALVEAAINGLYRLALDAFVGKRNALARQLKDGGDATAAKRVRACKKPSLSAWTVNRLWWDEPDVFGELLSAARRVGQAQARGAGPAELGEAEGARKRALRHLIARASALLEDQGHATTAATLRRISTTLEAIAARDIRTLDPPPGQLVEDLDPPGFDLLSALSSMGGPPRPPPTRAESLPGDPAQQAAARARALLDQTREHTQDALRRADQTQRRLDTAQAELEQVAEELASARVEFESARQRVERLEANERSATRDVGEVRKRLEDAQARAAEARQTQAKAERALEDLTG